MVKPPLRCRARAEPLLGPVMLPVKNHRIVRADPLPDALDDMGTTASIEPATRYDALGNSQQTVPHQNDSAAPPACP